ncbi:hypothetical protein QOT17_018282 [Balamuthia mandrillaris]
MGGKPSVALWNGESPASLNKKWQDFLEQQQIEQFATLDKDDEVPTLLHRFVEQTLRQGGDNYHGSLRHISRSWHRGWMPSWLFDDLMYVQWYHMHEEGNVGAVIQVFVDVVLRCTDGEVVGYTTTKYVN